MRATRAVLIVVLLFVTACGGGGSDDEPEDATATTEGATTTSEATTTTAARVAGFEADSVTAGDQHACALDADGKAWCWGYNRMGQLGDGTNTDSNVPVAVAGDATFTQLAAGRYFTCGLAAAGQARCWGGNSSGQLGNGATGGGSDDANLNSPVAVGGGLAFTSLVAGQLHVCGLVASGDAYCWGAYASGQLGNDLRGDQTAPGPSAPGISFRSLALGTDTHTCGLTADGTAWCWGNNTFGQLGTSEKTNARQPAPAAVSGGVKFAMLAGGRTHTCGIDTAAALWCWGGNTHGQLGDGTTEERLAPTKVMSEIRFAQVTANDTQTCAVSVDGEGFCWGANLVGQLGIESEVETATTPELLAGGLTFTGLSAGEGFTCGVADGVAYCWGSAGAGWLGNGTDDPKDVPTPVAVP